MKLQWDNKMHMDDFLRNNMAFFEEKFKSEHPFEEVANANLLEVYAKEIRQLMVERYNGWLA